MKKQYKGAVAAGHELTALAAAEILSDGGNAFDAIIASLLMACVVEPVLASLGGGGFLMAHSEAKTRLFDFFVNTPKIKKNEQDIEFTEIFADFGHASQSFHIGAGATATPGMIPGLFHIHEMLATLPMRRLAEPAINTARSGVSLSEYQAYLLGVVSPILNWTEGAQALFTDKGHTLTPGAIFKNHDLAECIEIIAHEGLKIATKGEIASAMSSVCDNYGGQVTMDDIAVYETHLYEPDRITIKDTTAFLNPSPSLGGQLIAHMFTDLANKQSSNVTPQMMLDCVRAVDTKWRHAPEIFNPIPAHIRSRGTTHISVIDAQGRAAAATVSNGEGNGRLVPGCGFMLNNMLGEDDLNIGGFHIWHPGKRLSSMMAPILTIGRDGSMSALGSGGSNRIRTALFQVLVHCFAEGLNLSQAIEAPRFHFEKGRLDFEDFFTDSIRNDFLSLPCEHRIWPEENMYFGGVHAVMRDMKGDFTGTGDSRREGYFLRI